MDSSIEIYKRDDNNVELFIVFKSDTVWLTVNQMSDLFQRDRSVISRHISSVFKEGELDEKVVCANFAHTTQHGAMPGKTQTSNVDYYNLDVIISVGYRVKSKEGTKFRQWATQRLKDYLVQGYAINERRLAQKNQEVEYLKTGIRILNRALNEELSEQEFEILQVFAKGLELLDDYDHEVLDDKGKSKVDAVYPSHDDYMALIRTMYSDLDSDVFAKPKDDSFMSSIGQIAQSFGDKDLYPSIEEKAANLLYFITKNHSFVDGNKRIAAACFIYFLDKNNALFLENGEPIIDNTSLASLTLFIANSRTEESEIVKRLIISVLNRNRS